jgi:aldehyde:ferredoxin oxidoreductase
VITGRAEKPVVLSVVDGEAHLIDASGLWGKDVYETTDLLKAAGKGIKVLAIGPAGENLVRFAAVGNDKGHFVGRTASGPSWGRSA